MWRVWGRARHAHFQLQHSLAQSDLVPTNTVSIHHDGSVPPTSSCCLWSRTYFHRRSCWHFQAFGAMGSKRLWLPHRCLSRGGRSSWQSWDYSQLCSKCNPSKRVAFQWVHDVCRLLLLFSVSHSAWIFCQFILRLIHKVRNSKQQDVWALDPSRTAPHGVASFGSYCLPAYHGIWTSHYLTDGFPAGLRPCDDSGLCSGMELHRDFKGKYFYLAGSFRCAGYYNIIWPDFEDTQNSPTTQTGSSCSRGSGDVMYLARLRCIEALMSDLPSWRISAQSSS